MDYSRTFGTLVEEPNNKTMTIVIGRKKLLQRDYDMRRPRLGLPSGFCPRWQIMNDIDRVIKAFNTSGYYGGYPTNINKIFRQHLEHFRNSLDVYYHIVKDYVFSRDEVYYRCLAEGSDFTTFITKSRAFSLQAKTALDETNLNDEYVHSAYTGYDSIIHERYLINWDDRDETIDWPYAMIEPEKIDHEKFEECLDELFLNTKIDKYEEDDFINLLEPVARKKTAIGGGETTLLKDQWVPEYDPGYWYATRRVVPTTSGHTRDTGVPDLTSLCMVKLMQKHARYIAERCKHSANCDHTLLGKRVRRVQKKKVFLHLDFKKFGLTFNRSLPNALLKRIGRGRIAIDDFTLETEDGIYATKRGGVLGWFDPIVSLCVIGILLRLRKELNLSFDFIVFNDDVEIGMDITDPDLIQLLKERIIEELESFDFIISHRKTYVSKMFIFLEQYGKADIGSFFGTRDKVENLDMTKRQLIVNQYAKSLSSSFNWEAKYYYALAHKFLRSTYLRDICQQTMPTIFEEEYDKPYELGGWTFHMRNNVNIALEDVSEDDLRQYYRLSRYKEPHLMPKMRLVNMKTVTGKIRVARSKADSHLPDHLYSNIKLDERVILTQEHRDAIEQRTAGIIEEDSSDIESEGESPDDGYYGDWG